MLDKDLCFHQFFLPWMLFNWRPSAGFLLEVSADFNSRQTIAENYLARYNKRLTAEEKQFISAMGTTYYSFYSVLAVERDRALVIEDIMLGSTHRIKERLGTHHLKQGDIIFSRLLTLNEQSIFIGMSPFKLPADYYQELIDTRKHLIAEHYPQGLTSQLLRNELAGELREYSFELVAEHVEALKPTFFNTDGELVEFNNSYFALKLPPERALEQLMPLTLSRDMQEMEDFLGEAEYDEAGQLQRVTISWLKKGNRQHKSWENTVMGDITLEKGQLILTTNSAKRAEKGKKLLRKYLGDAVVFQQTLLDPEASINSWPLEDEGEYEYEDEAGAGADKEEMLTNDLLKLPAVQSQLRMMAKEHWENWFDQPIPVLGHQTPREAAKSVAGRKKLEALLLEYEHSAQVDPNNPFHADVEYLRAELALD
jgi:hypothetical protein